MTAVATPTEAIEAEQAVLAVMLHHRPAITEARRQLAITEFHQPRHSVIFGAISDLAERGDPTDPVAVLGELTRTGDASKVGGGAYLHTLFAMPVTAVSVGYYAGLVKAAARRRAVGQVATRLRQATTDITDDDQLLDFLAGQALQLEVLLDERAHDAPIDGLSTWSEFLAKPDVPEDWIVPGMIERGEVFMLLGGEGAGKSWLSRQLCMCIAAGVHPFKPHEKITPQKTLLVDLENPEPTLRRQGRPLASQVARLAGSTGEAFLWHYPQGLNIRDHKDAQLLERVVADVRPAFVAIGSLYNAYQPGRDSWETAADEAKVVLNKIRSRYRVGLWVEHHMPKGDGTNRPQTPLGSSVWMRWPSYGRIVNRKAENVYSLDRTFRNDRDNREIPAGLNRGGELPWTAIWSEDDLDAQIQAAGPTKGPR